MATFDNLYNLGSFSKLKSFGDSREFKSRAAQAFGGKLGFGDSAGVILARTLTHIDPNVLQVKFPSLTFLNGMEVDNTGGVSAAITTLRERPQGGFATVGEIDSNKGKISLTGESSTIPVVFKQAHSEWSKLEIERAAMENRNLVANLISAHNQLYHQLIDEIGYLGLQSSDGSIRSRGLLNNLGFDADADASGTADTLSAADLYEIFADLITDQHSAVNNTPEYMANQLRMPVRVWNVLRAKRLPLGAEDNGLQTKNVLSALQADFPEVTFAYTHHADSVRGASNKSVVVAYSSARDVGVARIPRPLEIGDIVLQSSFDSRVDSTFGIAGYDLLEDAGGRYVRGL